MLACYFEKNSTSEEFENNLEVCSPREQIGLFRCKEMGVCDLPGFLILENLINLIHHINMENGLNFFFFPPNIKWFEHFVPDNVQIQVSLLTQEFGDRKTLRS